MAYDGTLWNRFRLDGTHRSIKHSDDVVRDIRKKCKRYKDCEEYAQKHNMSVNTVRGIFYKRTRKNVK